MNKTVGSLASARAERWFFCCMAALMVVVGTLTALHGVVRASGPPASIRRGF